MKITGHKHVNQKHSILKVQKINIKLLDNNLPSGKELR